MCLDSVRKNNFFTCRKTPDSRVARGKGPILQRGVAKFGGHLHNTKGQKHRANGLFGKSRKSFGKGN